MYTSTVDLESFSPQTAASQTMCGMMAEMEKKVSFIWKAEERICLVSDVVPGKRLLSLKSIYAVRLTLLSCQGIRN